MMKTTRRNQNMMEYLFHITVKTSPSDKLYFCFLTKKYILQGYIWTHHDTVVKLEINLV